jgi:hypothetical protein
MVRAIPVGLMGSGGNDHTDVLHYIKSNTLFTFVTFW